MKFETPDGGALSVEITRCLIAGWTGRDAAKIQEHIEELAELGVPRPSTTPLYYEVPAMLAVQAERVEALGEETSGEAEPVIIDDGERLWLGLGSDHTDRALETVGVAQSKAICAKPMATALWPLESVAHRLDGLTLGAEISADGESWTPYQQGTLAAMKPLAELILNAPASKGEPRLGKGVAMFCGTLPAIGGVRAAPWFRATLEDPETGAKLTLSYRTAPLPIVA